MDARQLGFIAQGPGCTILIAFFAIILAMILALFGALGRLSKNPIAVRGVGFYTSFFRGTPLIVQLFLIYLALPQIGRAEPRARPSWLDDFSRSSAVVAGILGLGLNYGAYMTEIFRAGIQSVGHGQSEAADALGMTYRQQMRRVVLPQAFRVIIPPTGNEFIAMIKDTALVSFLGVAADQVEIFRRASSSGTRDFKNLEALIARGRDLLGAHGDLHVLPGGSRPDQQGLRPGRDVRPRRRTGARQGGAARDAVARRSSTSRRRTSSHRDEGHDDDRDQREPVVRVENLHKSFGDLEVLKGIDMEVDQGEVVVIFGRSGSGKSTLLRCMNFLEDPTAGTIEVAGHPPRGRPPHQAQARAGPPAADARRAWCSSTSTCSRT